MHNKSSIVKQIFLVILAILGVPLIIISGSILLNLVRYIPVLNLTVEYPTDTALMQTADGYLSFPWLAVACLIYIVAIKSHRPILKAIGTRPSGNTLKFALIGFAIGALLNLLCVSTAMLNGDITLSLNNFTVSGCLFLLLVVAVQSFTEELIGRAFLYQRLIKITGKPVVAIILNAVVFSALHLANNGVTALALVNCGLVGIFLSLIVYYLDSFWCATAVHISWNYMQSIVFGLPNSGVVPSFSIFMPDVETARSSFFYDTSFGVEASAFTSIIYIASVALLLYIGCKHGKKPYNVWDNSADTVEISAVEA